MQKLYVVVRGDLPAGLQCAQACHGVRAFVEEHPEADRDWYHNSNNLVVLTVADESALTDLVLDAKRSGIGYVVFREPDLEDSVTCVVLQPGKASQKLTQRLPLALKKAA